MDLQLKNPAYISSSFSDPAHLRVEATAVMQLSFTRDKRRDSDEEMLAALDVKFQTTPLPRNRKEITAS